jgi:hypothetical protein
MQLADDACPSCGGAGGGPFGRPGSAWDDERYVCARCRGAGALAPPSQRPGIAKASSPPAAAKKRAAGDDEG